MVVELHHGCTAAPWVTVKVNATSAFLQGAPSEWDWERHAKQTEHPATMQSLLKFNKPQAEKITSQTSRIPKLSENCYFTVLTFAD